MSEFDERKNEHVTDDIGSAVKAGTDAVKSSKTLSKAAAQASSGNVAGAGFTLLRDSKTVGTAAKFIFLPIIVLLIIIILSLYALPSVIYEPVESFSSQLKEEWEQNVYDSDQDVAISSILAAFRVTGDIVGDFAKNVWENVKSFLRTGDGKGNYASTGDFLSNDAYELQVMGNEEAMMKTLQNKIDSCITKLSARQDDIKSAIFAESNEIKSVIRDRYSQGYDQFYVNIDVATNDITQEEAISLLSLYTVQNNADIQGKRVSDFMKWLGWYNSWDTGVTSFELSDFGVTCATKTWKGTFLPQYLMEQKYQEERMFGTPVTNFEEYGAPAVDLLLYVDCPSIDDLKVVKTTKRKTRTVRDADGNPVIDPETGAVKKESYTITIGTVNLKISIIPRDMNVLAEIAGLWVGDLSGDGITDPGGYRNYFSPQPTGGTYVGKGQFTWPLPGYTYISSPYGSRRDPITGKTSTHHGVDVPAATGTPIYAAADGVVKTASRNTVRGNYVVITHSNGYETLYEHMNANAVSKGKTVTAGTTIIGYVGSTGRSTGPHLHFEVLRNGSYQNPMSYFQ